MARLGVLIDRGLLRPRRPAAPGVQPYAGSADQESHEPQARRPDRHWQESSWARRGAGMAPGLISVLAAPAVLLLGPGELSWVASLAGVGLTLLYLFAYLSPFQSSVGGSVPTMPVLVAALLTSPCTWSPP
ncbi:hypothetical protein [Arsenicicoccus dermatophilus]|uniref:hypothetical protein n=1 Tax=Arsenicicoccus dermatophilus TaxID=1076331 RepID=UPI001F4D27BE|nr:hypothetical protein [Arsenicicoccus dermatophilus]MCH8613948.1 hypothetical protein [Arsenicicoccus dermatophilus]